jgi:hypothetical protein
MYKSPKFMPWRRKDYVPKAPNWVTGAGALLAVLFGILIGYTRWGTTASVVEIVERQLTKTETRIEVLEKRLGALESKLSVSMSEQSISTTNLSKSQVAAQPTSLQVRTAPSALPR